MRLIREQAWCIPCVLDGHGNRPQTTVQHVVEGRKRRGHEISYGACPWHHLGWMPADVCPISWRFIFGQSLARNPRAYHKAYGSEDLLVKTQDYLIEQWLARGPWRQYHLPRDVADDVQAFWRRHGNGSAGNR